MPKVLRSKFRDRDVRNRNPLPAQLEVRPSLRSRFDHQDRRRTNQEQLLLAERKSSQAVIATIILDGIESAGQDVAVDFGSRLGEL